MKNIILLSLLLLLVPFLAKAEDVIHYTNGDSLSVKVVEVGKDYIKYRKASNLDGPVYSESTKLISSIVYENGNNDIWIHNSYTNGIFKFDKHAYELQFKVSAAINTVIPQADLVFGLRLNSFFRIGLGLGISKKFFEYNKHTHFPAVKSGSKIISEERTWDYDVSNHLIVMPLFGNLKYNILDSKFSPYIQANLGYYVYTEKSEEVEPGFYGNYFIGLDWRLRRSSLSLEVGYETNGVSLIAKPDNPEYSTYKLKSSNGLSLGLGYSYRF